MEANFAPDWSALWRQQSEIFFTTTKDFFQQIGQKDQPLDPQNHPQQLMRWLESVTAQWQQSELSKNFLGGAALGKMLTDISCQALEQMVSRWQESLEKGTPITQVEELYKIWLDCCHQLHQQALRTQAYQQAYGDFLNAGLKLWQMMAVK